MIYLVLGSLLSFLGLINNPNTHKKYFMKLMGSISFPQINRV